MDISYKHPALRQLARFAPKDRRLQQIDRAEGLLGEIRDETRYPFDYLCYRVTGYRPEASSDLVLDGPDARHDLRMFVEELSRTAHQPVASAPEPVLTVEDVSGRYKVSTRTVNRWRGQGLVARRFVIDGRVKVAFLESSVARFVAEHGAQVERSGRFTLLTEAERDAIIHRARRLVAVGPVSLAEVARRVAKKLDRSPETVRTTIKAHDLDRPATAVFPPTTGPLDEAAKTTLYKAYLRGVGVESLAAQHRRTRSSVYRVVNEMRARRLLEQPLETMSHPSFDDPSRAAEILGPLPQTEDGRVRKTKAPRGLPPYLMSLYDVPLLGREQEAHLFRKMNYLKHRAKAMRDALDPARARTADLDRIEQLQEEALAVKNQIIRCNLRLVVSIAKRHVAPTNNFFELVSDGNMSLIRAVEKFDYARGNKFSTYASWAVMKNYARTIPEENHRRDRFVTGHAEMFDSAADNRTDEHESLSAQSRMEEAVKGMLGKLDDRERRIIVSRFGLGGVGEQTLEQLGKELGITKERVRQIESRAQAKLRTLAGEQHLDLPML